MKAAKDIWTSHDGSVTLYLGDCLDILPDIEGVDAIVTDPPYGMNWKNAVQVGANGDDAGRKTRSYGKTIRNDDVEFDPSPLLKYDRVVIWGMQHYPHKLAPGTVLVWAKKFPDAYGTFLSDGDLAWVKGGCGVYISPTINPASFQSERIHPTQKPVLLMAWCIEKIKTPPDGLVVDPYMGSGTTGIACIRTGRRFVGIEIDPEHFEGAKRRIEAELSQTTLFAPDQGAP